MRRYRRSAGMPVRSCQYFRGYGNPYVCDIITRRIRGRMIIAAMSRRAAFAGCCGTLADVFNVRNPRAYRLTICPRHACKGEKPAEVRQGHFAKYMAPGHGVRKIYSSRVCAVKRAIKKRRVRGDIHVDSDKACLKRQVMHNVHKMWITSLYSESICMAVEGSGALMPTR